MEIDALAELLKPLHLDYETSEKIMFQARLATVAEAWASPGRRSIS